MKRATPTSRRAQSRRGMALVIALMAVGVCALTLAGTQAISFRQAASARETVARLRAYWAARAGLEETIARFEMNLQSRDPGSFFTLPDDLAEASVGSVQGATWQIAHDDGLRINSGPADPHAKLNINRMSKEDLMTLEFMAEDVADAILDWIDADDEPNDLGAEVGYYSSLPSPYEPRNGPMRSLMELELVAGVESVTVRGEDWNLNGVLDANENDGDASWPPDNADGVLDAGWSAILTASSVDVGLAPSGSARLSLKAAEPDQLIERVPGIDLVQATAIIELGKTEGARIEQLITMRLSALSAQNTGAIPARDLTDDQLRSVLDEATFEDPSAEWIPGRANVNTLTRDALDHITAVSPGLADLIILTRDGSATGFTSLLDLLEIPAMSRNRLVNLSQYLGVESASYVVTVIGRDDASGVEAQIVATMSGTTLPVVLTEVRHP